MIDDLEGMGVEKSAVARNSLAERSSGVVEYERLLNLFIKGDAGLPGFPFPGLCGLLSRLSGTLSEAHAAVLHLNPTSDFALERTGLFLSEVYNRVPDRVITYDLPIPVICLAQNFPRYKLLINRGICGRGSLNLASGIVVNEGFIKSDYIADRGIWLINRPSGELSALFADDADHFFIDISRKRVSGHFLSNSVNSGYELRLYNDPQDDNCLRISAHGLTRRFLLRHQLRKDAPEALLKWLSSIDDLASTAPGALLNRYKTLGLSPSHGAQRELFDFLFEKRGGGR